MQVVLLGVEPARALGGAVEAAVPRVGDPRLRALGEQQERPRAREGDDPDAVPHGGDVHLPGVAVRAPMVVAVVDEHLELEPHGPPRAQRPVAHVGRIGARLHPDALLDEGVGHGVRPHGRGPVEGEPLDRLPARRVHDPAGPAVGREGPGEPVVLDGLVHVRHEQRAPERRRERRDEQAVVAARQRARDRARREAAEAVGAEPLAPLGGGEVARDLAAPVDHASRSTRWSATRSALAMIVSAGFTAALDGKTLASTT